MKTRKHTGRVLMAWRGLPGWVQLLILMVLAVGLERGIVFALNAVFGPFPSGCGCCR